MASAIVTASFVWIALQASAALLRYGFKFKPLAIGWFTVSVRSTLFNRSFHTVGRRHHNELRQWFGLGVVVAAMLGASSVVILVRELWHALKWATQGPGGAGGSGGSTWEFGFAIPGLTVPWNHAIYLWVGLAISVGVHEAGHALAAASEGVGVHYLAGFTTLLLPGAQVALDKETLAVLNPWRTLRIVCGGVWHNAVLCLICWLIAFLMPFLLLPVYSTGQGAVVRLILDGSPLANHLQQADVVTQVNQCHVRNGGQWLNCMAQLPGHDNPSDLNGFVTANQLLEIMGRPAIKPGGGYCLPRDLQAHSRSCKYGSECSIDELCFHELRPHGRKLSDEASDSPHPADRSPTGRRHFAYGAKRKQFDAADDDAGGGQENEATAVEDGTSLDLAVDKRTGALSQGLCVQAKKAVGYSPCGYFHSRAIDGLAGRCPSTSTCHVPSLPAGEELLKICFKKGFNTKALREDGERDQGLGWRLHRRLNGAGNSTVHRALQQMLGLGTDIGGTQKHSGDKNCQDYFVFVGSRGSLLQAVEVTDFCPAAWWVPMRLPYVTKQLLAYTFDVSAALALLNMAPIYGLDGEAALKSLMLLGEPTDPFYAASRMGTSLRLCRRLFHLCVMNVGTSIFALLLALQILRLSGYDVLLLRLLAAVRHLLKFTVRWG